MDDLEAATLASLAGGGALSQELANLNFSSVSEEDELRMLNFPASKHEDLWTAIPLTVVFALLLVTGSIGSMCTAIVIARPKNKYMHTATNYYLFSLAMSDFLFLILGLPQEMFTLWQRYPYAFGESFCIIRGYLSEATTYASILTISAFTIERYVAICHPLWAHTMSQLPRAVTSIVIIWLLAAICAIPPAAELGIVTQKGPITHRTLEQSAQCATKRTIYENMFVVSAIVFFIVPMIIVTVLYILIAIELRRSSKMNNAITKQSSSSNNNNHHNYHHPHQKLTACGHPYPYAAHQRRTNQPSDRLKGHLRSASRSHQQIAATTTGFVGEYRKQDTDSPEIARTDHESLMANIMSQRPSSAIGTEHSLPVAADEQTRFLEPGVCSMDHQVVGGYGDRAKQKGHLSFFLPLFWTTTPPAQAESSSTTCLARGHTNRQMSCGIDGHCLQHSQSNLFPSSPTPSHGVPLSPDPSHKSHAPLSYHESLIQRQHSSSSQQQQLAASHNQLGVRSSAQQNSHHHLQPTHQMSLQHSPSYQPQSCSSTHNLATQGSCQHYNPPSQHHHHHHGGSGNRRSAAASSKKSVIRMLVAVVVSFFICWVPFHAQRLLASYLTKDENQNQFLLSLYGTLTHLSGVLYYLTSTINPILYQLMSAKFRLAFEETFKCSLFKCFGQQSKTATHGSGRSPTNSLREHQHHHHHKQLNSSSCCNTPAAGAHWFPAQPPRSPLPHSKVSQPDSSLYAQPTCSCRQSPMVGYPPLDATAKQEVDQLQAHYMATPVGLIARLRGRMSTSKLVSLFRLNGRQARHVQCGSSGPGSSKLATGCTNCCCCGSSTMAAGSSTTNGQQRSPGGQRFIYNQLFTSASAGNETGQLDESSGRQTQQMAANSLKVEVTLCNGGRGSSGSSSSSSSASAANNPANGCPRDPWGTSTSLAQQSEGTAQQVGPAHTMLKFIRSSSPGSIQQQPQQRQNIPLSRVSSREEVDDSDGGGSGARDETSDRRRAPIGRPQNSLQSDNRNERYIGDENNNGPVINAREEEDKEQMSCLIEPTNLNEELDDETRCDLIQVQSLGLTSESGNSSGSSPDQHITRLGSGCLGGNVNSSQKSTKQRRCFGGLNNSNRKVSRTGSSTAFETKNTHPPVGKRRRSLQQSKNHHPYITSCGGNVEKRQMDLDPMAYGEDDEFCLDQRRESNTSSNNKHPISSSLSSSDRQLDKKLSFSTTTSAIDDCGSSFTTTNSQLTGAGSHPTLMNQNLMGSNLSSERIDDEEATVINLHRCHNDDDREDFMATRMASGDNNETEIPLLGDRCQRQKALSISTQTNKT